MVKEKVRVELKRMIQKTTGRRPMIMPVIWRYEDGRQYSKNVKRRKQVHFRACRILGHMVQTQSLPAIYCGNPLYALALFCRTANTRLAGMS